MAEGTAHHEEAPPPTRRRRLLRRIGLALAIVVVLVLVAGVAGFWWLGREATLQRIVSEAEKALAGQLQIEGVTGSVYDRIAFKRLVFRSKTQVITVDDGSLRYRLEPFARRFTIVDAHAATLTIETIGKSTEPAQEPDTLALPSSLHLDALHVDAVHLDAIRLVDGASVTTLGEADLAGRYGSEGGTLRWTIERIAVTTPWGRAEGRGKLDADKPFAIDATITASGTVDGVPYQAPLAVRGALADLTLSSNFTVADPSHAPLAGHADARLLPFRDQPVDHATLHVAGFSPRRWKDALPDADITVDAAIAPRSAAPGRNPFDGTLRIANAKPGPVDAGRIPLVTLETTIHGDAATIEIERLQADLGAAGTLQGHGRYVFANGGEPSFAGTVDRLDLKAIQTKLITTRFAGPVMVARSAGAISFGTHLADAGRRVAIAGTFADRSVALTEADLVVAGSHVAASGRIGLAGPRPFDVRAVLSHVDPHDFGDFAKADLNATLHLDGSLGEPAVDRRPGVATVNADVRLDPSRVLERPVSGSLVGQVTAAIAATASKGGSAITLRSITGAHAAVVMGADRLKADGDFGRPNDRLDWSIDAPRLADLDAGLGGALKATGMLGGTTGAPSLDFDLAADALTYAKPVARPASGTTVAPRTVAARTTAFSLGSLRARGRLAPGQKGVVDVTASLTDLREQATAATTPALQAATLRLDGTRDAHRLNVTASSDRFDVTLAASGGLDSTDTWRGEIGRFENRGRLPFSLAGTLLLVAGPGQIRVGAATLKFQEGELALDHLNYLDDRLDTSGRANGFPLAIVGTFSKDFAQRISTTLTFGATWDLRAGEAIDGRVRIFREAGNLRFLTQPRLDVDVRQLSLDADVVANHVKAHVVSVAPGLGNVDATVETTLARQGGRWGVPGAAPLRAAGTVDVPDLQGLARLSGVDGLSVGGALQANVTASGTIGHPLLGGEANGQALVVRWPDQGVNVRDGHVDVAFEGDRIVLKQATFAGGRGDMNANGDLRLGEGGATGMLAVDFRQFEAVARSDRTMVVSGTGGLRFGPTGIDVTGDVKADRGVLQLAERNGPATSSDIVIVGRDADQDVPAPSNSVPVRFEIRFDMGDDFGVRGSGFDGKLGGNIRISGTGSDLRAIGTVAVREGTYEGYGQKLNVTRGNLIFSGPIDNPALDILAVRKGLAVEAGVQVSGTALAPVARLVSTPDVPDTEKLSWLILGHGLASATKSDYATLASAAAGLLGSSNSTGIQARIAATLGVDEVGFATDSTTGAGLLTIGKQISSRLRVNFEQGLTKTATLIKVRYNIYQRIDLQVTAGTESAIDIFYTFSFD